MGITFELRRMIAVIQTGGKQYKVAEGKTVRIEKIVAEIGKEIALETLFIGNEGSVQLGAPILKSPVTAIVVTHGRYPKVTGIRHKAKKREMTRYGHRQEFTTLRITKIPA